MCIRDSIINDAFALIHKRNRGIAFLAHGKILRESRAGYLEAFGLYKGYRNRHLCCERSLSLIHIGMQGSRTPAVLVAAYGDREYDDALLELADIAAANGLSLIHISASPAG